MNAATTKQSILATPATTTPHNDDVMFYVRDTAASSAPRTHIMLDDNNKEVPFLFESAFKELAVPYRFAIRFAAIDGFIVRDANQRQIRAVQTKRADGFRLKSNEVITTLDKLVHEELVARAVAAGGKFSKGSKKDEMIAFLTAMDNIVPVEEEVFQRMKAKDAPAAGDVVLSDGTPLPAGSSLIEPVDDEE
jgi:hypothetical protein